MKKIQGGRFTVGLIFINCRRRGGAKTVKFLLCGFLLKQASELHFSATTLYNNPIKIGLFHYQTAARAAPSALHSAIASSEGASLHITDSVTSTAPSAVQVSSQLLIHSPSPHP